MLIVFVVSATPIPVPANFSTPAPYYLSTASPGPTQIFYGVVGRNGLTGATSYSLGNGPLIAQMIDIAGENEQLAPSFSVDSPIPSASPTTTPIGQVGRNESVLTAQGFDDGRFRRQCQHEVPMAADAASELLLAIASGWRDHNAVTANDYWDRFGQLRIRSIHGHLPDYFRSLRCDSQSVYR